MSLHDRNPARPNLSTDDGYECPRCGCDHAPRFGICWSCVRDQREAAVELGRRVADVLREKANP